MVEQYLDYAPPVDVYRSLRLLLRHVPEQYLTGLYKITLTNSDSLRSSYRGKFWSEKRRLRPADCSGLYHKGAHSVGYGSDPPGMSRGVSVIPSA